MASMPLGQFHNILLDNTVHIITKMAHRQNITNAIIILMILANNTTFTLFVGHLI